MKSLITMVILANLSGIAAAADTPRRSPSAPLDTSFLKLYAETRGFMNGRPAKPKISPDGKSVFFLRSEAKSSKQTLFLFDVASKQTRELLTPQKLLAGAEENLSPEEKARRERQRVSAGGFADYHLDSEAKRVLVSAGGKLFVFDIAANQAKELKGVTGTIDPKWSPDDKMISYVRGHDVYVYDLASDKEMSVTTGGTAIKTHGLAEFVAQEEMHRHTGYWWSPDSKFIAYEEADHTGVEVWSIVDPLKPDTKAPEQFYPRPGKKNVSVRLGIVPVAGGKTVWVEWDRKKYEYLAAVRWDVIGGLTVTLQDRGQHNQFLLSVNHRTGQSNEYFVETSPSWSNLNQMFPFWINAEQFYWLSDIDGDNRLYLVEMQSTGKAKTFPISPKKLQVIDGIEPLLSYSISIKIGYPTTVINAGYVYPPLIATEDPTQTDICVLSNSTDTITSGLLYYTTPGVHSAVSTRSGSRTMVCTFTSLASMPVSTFREKIVKAVLPSVALEPDFKPNVTIQKVSDYWTAIVRPRNFDPKKKYPVIVDVYGGPRHLHVIQAMRNWLIPQWLADQGFIVVAIDNRGTPGRGRDWERAVYQKFGTVPLEDQVKGLHALCDKFPELDRDRVGIVGWSFGGYMAANAVLRQPDVFKAAVAGAPVTDWEDYDTHYTERYMGLLPESRKAYDEASLIPLAKNLSRPLLLVHGTADDNVFFRHSLKLADALMRAGKDFEFLPLPGVTHMYTADPAATERLWERSVRFFKQHLGEAK